MTRWVRHPRRLGFIAFNAIALLAFLASWSIRADGMRNGVPGLPNVALGTTAMVIVAAVWAACWIAWGWMVWLRRRRVVSHRHGPAQ